MRSRLEASVAAWLDHHQAEWTYEPQAYGDEAGQYLPDFRLDGLALHGDGGGTAGRRLFVEVKPPRFDGIDVRERMQVIWSSEQHAALAVWAGGRLQPVVGGFPMAIGAGDGTGAWRRGFAGLCVSCDRLVVHIEDETAGCSCGWKGEARPLRDIDAAADLVDLDAEVALLGSLVANPGVRADVSDELQPDHFAASVHGMIFDALMRLPDGAGIEDVRRLLEATGAANAAEALSRLGPALSTDRTKDLAARVGGWAALRSLRDAGADIIELAASATPIQAADTVASARALLDVFDVPFVRGSSVGVRETLVDLLDHLERSHASERHLAGVPTRFGDLDGLLGGLLPGHLYVVGARPSIGKSALALNIATNIAVWEGRPVLFASLEMDRRQLTERVVCAEARVQSERVRSGRLSEEDWNRISAAVERTAQAPLTFTDDFGLTVAGLRKAASEVQSRYGDLGLAVIDYLQLLGARRSAENRQVEVAEMSRGLKVLAGDLAVPVLACSQLSRQLELRADKRPMLGDLRESGAIENDADVVIFIYRDDFYNPDTPDLGQAELIVAKHRGGPTGTGRLAFLDQYTRFANLARHR